MKKRIMISWLVTLGVILLAALGLFLLSISPWAHKKSEDGIYYAESVFEFGIDAENANRTMINEKDKDDAGFEYSVNCLKINGAIVVKVCYMHDVTGTTDEEKIDSAYKLLEHGDFAMVLEQRIDAAGTYCFDLSEEKNGFYVFCIEKLYPDTYAKGTERLTIYSSNWSVLMDRIGVK